MHKKTQRGVAATKGTGNWPRSARRHGDRTRSIWTEENEGIDYDYEYDYEHDYDYDYEHDYEHEHEHDYELS